MYRIAQKVILPVFLLFLNVLSPLTGHSGAVVADHNALGEFIYIPEATFEQIRNNYSFYYGHTSHGSQIITGLDMLAAESLLFTRPSFYEPVDDLGHVGDTSWVADLRYRLDNYNYNVAMMSWCGGVSDNTEEGINIYLNKMNELEIDYPAVTFIYMTGHLDGTGIAGNLYVRNNQIRNYCNTNDKVLFDFADIESYDPDGNFYPDESDACGWCTIWCGSHDCPGCVSCAHSHCFNCYNKGKVFWWMMARVVGWSPSVGVQDDDRDGLPQSYELRQNSPNPFNLSTEIGFSVPTTSGVRLEIYDILGNEVIVLIDKYLPAGQHIISWDGLDRIGKEVATGIYFYQLKADDFTETRKMVLLK